MNNISTNVLITGATGFIGRHLLRRLVLLNYNVSILVRDRSDLSLIGEDIKKVKLYYFDDSYESVDRAFQNSSFDLVFHLAAFGNYFHDSNQISQIIDSNIKLGTFILDAMKVHKCNHLINTSTYWQHYQGVNYIPICLYAATKKAFEGIIDYYVVSSYIKAISLTLYDIYGYDDNRPKLLNLLLKGDSEQSFDLTLGEQMHHMVFIDDVVDGYINAAGCILDDKNNLIKHEIYSLPSNKMFSLKELVGVIKEISKKRFNINWGKKPYYELQIMNPYVGKVLPGWKAKISLQKGIQTILKSLK